jgi:hypothetical protein
MDGDAIWLTADDHRFLSIFTQAENGARENTMVVMHGTGVHPNWDQVVQLIRVEMTTCGWKFQFSATGNRSFESLLRR